jgi:hypothetical protein
MRNYLIRFAFWILGKFQVPVIKVPEGVLAITPAIREVVSKTSGMEGLLSNEYRHSHSYATLRKRIPEAESRDIGLGIELVIYGLI